MPHEIQGITIICILMKASANPLLLGAFTMRGAIVDTASDMLAAITLKNIAW